MGGLGNQMFQFAAGFATSKKLNTKLFLDLSWFNQSLNQNNITSRKFELDKFELGDFILYDLNILKWVENKENKLKYVLNHLLGRSIHKVTEKHIEYTEITGNKKKHLYLEGYWQSHKYFLGNEHEIKSLFLKPVDYFNNENRTIADRMRSKNSIAIHIRRGDYVRNIHANSFHGLCSMDYYLNAIDYLVKNNYANPNSELFIFSDEIEWVKNNLKVDYNTYYVNHNSSEQAHLDLLLMSQCEHHILANSSFSWWGAYLSTSKGKKIAPKSWYAGSSKDTSFMFPEAWIRL